MKALIRLFLVFFKIGLFTFGGGYAMLPILQREIVEKNQWAREEDLANYYAIGQTTPGIIAVNTATFIGYRQFGLLGAISATIGLISPGVVIIGLLVNLLVGLSDVREVQYVMKTLKVAVSVLILEAILKLRKNALVDNKTRVIFLIILALALFFPWISPALWVVLAGGLGILLANCRGGKA